MTSSAGAILLPPGFRYRPELSREATSRDLDSAPRHRWFYFPHSYSYRLVNRILDHWQLPDGSLVADNFAGAGTTLLAARERRLAVLGFDVSPLAITVANAKVASYDVADLARGLQNILNGGVVDPPEVPARLSRAFTGRELREIFTIVGGIQSLPEEPRRFFLVALLCAMGGFSRAVPDGGWFRWRTWPDRSTEIRDAFKSRASLMIDDVQELNWPDTDDPAPVQAADARALPLAPASVDALITSPPYANRHDYSRVFHIALLLLGCAESEVTKLRHRSIRSHVEAKPPSGWRVRRLAQYQPPPLLTEVLQALPPDLDPRIARLLRGYFQDIYLSFVEVTRALRPGGRAAYVLGNVRHAGVMVPVDEVAAQIAPQAGLSFDAGWVMRFRGNAAQQMGRYGREPSRESVVLLAKGEHR